MTALLLIRGGGHCHTAIDVIEACDDFSIKGIVDAQRDAQTTVLGYPVVGTDDDLAGLLAATPHALVTVGQIKTAGVRQQLFERLRALGAIGPVVVSPRAYASPHASVGAGTLVMHGAIVNAGARIGANVIVNTLALVEHDVSVGEHCHMSTGARVNGRVVVEDGCFVGSGSVVREGVRVGAGSVIGAGCVVTRDLPAGSFLRSQS